MKMRSQMHRINQQKGFTLVELMVVVVIIGILVAIAVPIYNTVTEKAERGAIEANLKTVDGAIMMATASEVNADATWFSIDTNMAKYVTGYPDLGPKGCKYSVTTIDGNFRAQVKIPAGVAGYQDATDCYLDKDKIKPQPPGGGS